MLGIIKDTKATKITTSINADKTSDDLFISCMVLSKRGQALMILRGGELEEPAGAPKDVGGLDGEQEFVAFLGDFLFQHDFAERFDVGSFEQLDEAELVQGVEVEADHFFALAEIFRQVLGAHATAQELAALLIKEKQGRLNGYLGHRGFEHVKELRGEHGILLGQF